MRIVLDMQGAQTESRFRGIGRYTISLTKAIIQNRGEHEIILALSGLLPESVGYIRNTFDGLLPQENIRVWHAPSPIKSSEPGNKIRREIAEKIYNEFLKSLLPDIIHIFSPFEGYGDESITDLKSITKTHIVTTTVYDLIPLIYPDSYLNHHPDYKRYYLSKLDFINHTSAVITISEYSKYEISSHLNNYTGMLVNCYLGADEIFKRTSFQEDEIVAIKRRYNINNGFILYTGGADERKNLYRLIEAYANLPESIHSSHCLVFAGKIPQSEILKLNNVAKSNGLNPQQLIFTGYISDDELNSLFNICDLFVFPSWHEGFGLPALEAMKCGAAVIASNQTSIPEVINNARALFDPYNVESITSKILEILQAPHLQEDLKKQGIKQAEEFSWENSAKKVIENFEILYKAKIQTKSNYENDENSLGNLINDIAIIKSIKKQDLLGISYCLNKTFPEKNRLRQILIDISDVPLNQSDEINLFRSLLITISQKNIPGVKLRAVHSNSETQHYFYADNFLEIENNSSINYNLEQGKIIDVCNGDIFLVADFNKSTIVNKSDILGHWHDQGLIIKTLVSNLSSLTEQTNISSETITSIQLWLKETIKYDGVIGTSECLAKSYLAHMSDYNTMCRKTFSINWFPLAIEQAEDAFIASLLHDSNKLKV